MYLFNSPPALQVPIKPSLLGGKFVYITFIAEELPKWKVSLYRYLGAFGLQMKRLLGDGVLLEQKVRQGAIKKEGEAVMRIEETEMLGAQTE